MNVQLLIDAIVRQTTVLIAQLATSGGLRAPLAHIANEVFLELAAELDGQGVSRKVSADMFGMALRAYLRKIQRLRESRTVHGRSLWEAVLSFVQERTVVARRDVLENFYRDDEELVRGVLHDLTEGGFVFRSGSAGGTTYRAASDDERTQMRERATDADELVWLMVYRDGPVTRDAIAQALRLTEAQLALALSRLVAGHRIRSQNDGPIETYLADEFVVPLGQSQGWEAAVLDHYQAVVRTMCRRLDADAPPTAADRVGGSTYTFDVWEGHPMADEVYGWLRAFRARAASLRERLKEYNAAQHAPDEYSQVVVYGGQCVTSKSRSLEADEK